ncbi:MAG: FMN-binding protein [Clostridia bacterium]|nr:FMN-binding protein [Clostridia bacterium]
MKKAIIIPTISLFLICLFATLLLGVVNGVTEEKIAQNAIITEENSRKIVMADAASFVEIDKDKSYTFDGTTILYSYADALDENGKTIGYVLVTDSTGYGGKISTMTGIDTEGKVTGIEFLEIGETVGLGMNATKPTFKDQFKGLVSGIIVNKNAPSGNEIKALTGATITSKAVTKGVNTALDIYENVIKGGANNG